MLGLAILRARHVKAHLKLRGLALDRLSEIASLRRGTVAGHPLTGLVEDFIRDHDKEPTRSVHFHRLCTRRPESQAGIETLRVSLDSSFR